MAFKNRRVVRACQTRNPFSSLACNVFRLRALTARYRFVGVVSLAGARPQALMLFIHIVDNDGVLEDTVRWQ